ncbi:dTDP-4-dehydrorhamnose reductase [Albidovulum inexpectatum]|uniref:dTDP-4-dehydrorhamnose reductase n=1 Tax=Albidovulum inexpectatum TaxID=196587 RepID=A0A2S5JDE9_9RHOB|nr:dTDP-4-dehydrorhamnose reductase [Albidovulum inexpectatum]PPB79504.1 dTDP-4-dehydrorhamnose reductase [Albidovulum inexpectatum]
MKALIFGRTGQLAIELVRRAPEGANLVALGRDAVDLAHPDACARAVTETDADIVINAAAYTAVDQAESEPELARRVNAQSPGAMARAAAARGLPFIHVSTDYVFDGSGNLAWREDDSTGPLGVYGRTKLEGEQAVLDAGGTSVILRTAWVFSAHGRNFVKTMLRLGAEREELSIVADQRGGPTAAANIADAIWTIAAAFEKGKGVPGIYHFAGAPAVTWADFAEAIFAASRRIAHPPRVRRITTSDYPTPARRPANSVLDCTKIHQTYGIAQPDWRQSLAEVIEEIEADQ